MSKTVDKRKIFYYLSLTLFILGIISWIPYVVFDLQVPYGMLTFILNPIGIIFGSLARNKRLAYFNLAMVFSFIPVVIYVYLSKGYIPM